MGNKNSPLRCVAEARINHLAQKVLDYLYDDPIDPDRPIEALSKVTCAIFKSRVALRSFATTANPLGYLIGAISKELSKPKRKDARLLEGAAAIDPDGSVGSVPTRDTRANDPAAMAETRDLAQRAQLALAKIEQQKPPVVTMTYFDGAGDAEIGERLNLSRENVRFRRWADIHKLKNDLKRIG